jgi:DNA-binding PadR family transcriptional regulator
VLQQLLREPERWQYGYDLSRSTGLKSGTLYPILVRLAEQGWLEARWTEPARVGRPPRHLYRLTADGMVAATRLTAARATRGSMQPRPGRQVAPS